MTILTSTLRLGAFRVWKHSSSTETFLVLYRWGSVTSLPVTDFPAGTPFVLISNIHESSSFYISLLMAPTGETVIGTVMCDLREIV